MLTSRLIGQSDAREAKKGRLQEQNPYSIMNPLLIQLQKNLPLRHSAPCVYTTFFAGSVFELDVIMHPVVALQRSCCRSFSQLSVIVASKISEISVADDGLPKDFRLQKLKTSSRRLDAVVSRITSVGKTLVSVVFTFFVILSSFKCFKSYQSMEYVENFLIVAKMAWSIFIFDVIHQLINETYKCIKVYGNTILTQFSYIWATLFSESLTANFLLQSFSLGWT